MYVFNDYRGMQSFRLLIAPWYARPFLRIKYAVQQAKEKKLETQLNLPPGYLSGLFTRVPEHKSHQQVAYAIARNYFLESLRKEMEDGVGRYFSDVIGFQRSWSPITFDTSPTGYEQIYQAMEPRRPEPSLPKESPYDQVPPGTHDSQGICAQCSKRNSKPVGSVIVHNNQDDHD